jgi:hypothetical protein
MTQDKNALASTITHDELSWLVHLHIIKLPWVVVFYVNTHCTKRQSMCVVSESIFLRISFWNGVKKSAKILKYKEQ